MDNVRKIENVLTRLHEKEYAHIVGSGTAGIYLTLVSLGLTNKSIGIPYNSCINVPMAVLFSGNIPCYLDIMIDDLGIDFLEIDVCPQDLDVVIAIHSYGSVCDIENIAKLCRDKGIFLIEDLAPAQGARYGSNPVGVWGDAAIVSFGAGKIVAVGHGGAILTDDKNLIVEIRRVEQTVPGLSLEAELALAELNKRHTKLYNQHYGKHDDTTALKFQKKALATKSAYLHKFNGAFSEVILAQLDHLQENIRARDDKAKQFTKLLQDAAGDQLQIFSPSVGSVYWRFNLFVDQQRNALLKYLLIKKYKVSSWFPSVDVFFQGRSKDIKKHLISDDVGDRILNIWVNDEIDGKYIASITSDILNFIGSNKPQ